MSVTEIIAGVEQALKQLPRLEQVLTRAEKVLEVVEPLIGDIETAVKGALQAPAGSPAAAVDPAAVDPAKEADQAVASSAPAAPVAPAQDSTSPQQPGVLPWQENEPPAQQTG